ncbi:Apoptosis inhibitor, putative [Pediculus humanus corporis]|uniref:Apoptosis inhibitor, putative n=1 Tax=Pediculus humanus subsp. corporis TaxID=121224 RepID=E0VBA0_PEDHC|nr:Apoptosis inhibitor, putative [Pediculus humanus corporis]EEB10656.1 Apoptosis inhibitor, putative [Pediculus humanus corporis]
MSTDSIEKLYKNFGILADSKDKIGEHVKEYLEIMTAVKGSSKEKRLASQFITRFFKYFPSVAEQAIECLFDLCEDEDIETRKQAIKDLPSLCKDNKQFTQKIADILAQLLQAEDSSEIAVVNNSLLTLLSIDPKGCLSGLFNQILSGEDFVREKCIKFLTVKIRNFKKDELNAEAEAYMITEIKKVLQDVTANEFNVLMELLGSTKLGKSISGHQELVDLVAEQVELDHPFSPGADEESELLDRLINCVRHALPYFSSQISSSRFVSYICEQILPQLERILTSEEDSPIELDLLKILAELCTHCGAMNQPEKKVLQIYQKLLVYMPLPPNDGTELTMEPRLEFSHVECLMYAFHKLVRQCPEFLSDADRLKDFKLRLQYFARGIQGYIKKLREALCGKTAEELKSEDNRLKVVALKTTSNINILIKDLFHSPPSFKSVINLSWKPLANSLVGVKRHTPITFGESKSSPKQKKTLKGYKEVYTPPSGKYSDKISGYIRGRGNLSVSRLGGGGGRGKFRGGRTWRRMSY